MSELSITLAALAPVRRRLGRIAGTAARLLDVVGAEVEAQTRLRIAEEKRAPDGDPWQDWSERYAAQRPAKGGLLELEGHLLDSITYEVGTDVVVVGSNIVYARRHQEGDEAEGEGIPARPYLGLSKANERALESLVVNWLDKELAT